MQKSTTKLNIGFVVDDGLDRPDGVQQYVLTIGEWMKAQGHTVSYLAGETARTDIPNLHSLSRNLSVRFNGNKLTTPFPARASRIKQIIDESNFDVLHIQVPYSPVMAGRVVSRAKANTAVVGTFHILPYSWPTRLGNHVLGLALRRNLRRFNAQISVSRPASDFAKSSFGIETQIIPNAVDTKKYAPKSLKKINKKELSLVFVGRLVERKGCSRLIEVLSRINKEQNAPFVLHICGDGALRPSLEQYVEDNDLSDKVVFHGFVTEDEKIRQLQGADVAIFPSLSGESFGIVLIEAMACGAGVVLGGDNPGYQSVIGSVKNSIVNVHDDGQFYEQLLAIMHNSKLRSEMHRSQQILVKQFDVDVVGSQLLGIYNSCINSRKKR